MVVIFGWGSGEAQDLGEVAPATCPNCHNHVFLHHIKSEKRVSLYFVPLVPYGSNEYLACPICRSGLQLRPEHLPGVRQMHAATLQFRRGALRQDLYQARVEHFWRTLGVGPSGTQVVRPAPTVPPPATVPAHPASAPQATPALRDRLEDLARLHADGVLTDEEFAAAKRRILGI
jgi:Short C-terminal domain